MAKKSKPKIRYKKPSQALTEMAVPSYISATRASLGIDNVAADVYSIKVEQLVPYAHQARKIFDDGEIAALAETIKDHGIRQPLTVIRSADDHTKYQVISGERRLRAALKVGLSKVPCIILEDASKANEVALIENLHRSDLHPIETATAYQALLTSGICASQQEIADKLSLKKSQVSEILKLDALPDDIKEYMLIHNIKARDTLRKLSSLSSVEEMKRYLNINQEKTTPNKTPAMKSASILRITLSEGVYKIQKKAMSVLNQEQKKLLRLKLQEIIDQLSS